MLISVFWVSWEAFIFLRYRKVCPVEQKNAPLRFQTTKWTQNIHYFQIQCRVYKVKEDGRWKIKIRIRKKEIEAG